MLSKDKIVAVGRNKVLLYVTSRYVTYGIQFVNSMFIAIALGPEYLAIWGFINLILQYIAQFNAGVPYSLNVLLSINKNDKLKVESLLSTALFLYVILSVIIVLVFLLLHLAGIDIGSKYSFDKYMVVVVIIAVITHFNTIYTNYFRIMNKLLEIVFFQSIVPLSMLIAICFAKGEKLVLLILWIMLVGQLLSLLLYLKNSHLKYYKPDFSLIKPLLRKGVFLFFYNTCFYCILLSTRTVVSSDYEIKEFGFFTFSFTLANTIMLLFDSFSFLIYPKTINRFNKANGEEIVRILNLIRVNYITSIHFAMYVFLLLFPLIINLFPQYKSVFKCFGFMALTVVFYGNCFAYSCLLTARGKEQLLSILAFVVLIVNIALALFISKVLKLGYEYVILATLISYMFYNILLSFFSYRMFNLSFSLKSIFAENFTLRLFLPFSIAFIILAFEFHWIAYLSLLILFVVLNWKQIVEIKNTIIRILYNPTIINI
ncbi:hypothetical protein [uncultured Parabacteroides sp.]|uniref:lipopolysaccharide biosynthesis protein n=1 Tax=uncultured Parabacteroides sp. TaxID=512312 RepID=UPI0025FADA6E|nr:hypothetical protein [uncultured Parabacteroides sp.]